MAESLTDEQIVLRGQLAESYLNDAALMDFVNEMKADLLTCIGSTGPEDHQARNRLYYQHLGLVDLLAHLSAYCVTANQILERDLAEAEAQTTDMDTD